MSCIKDDLIQKYIDGETTENEISLIEEHLVNCEECATKVGRQQKLASSIKKGINLLTTEKIVIPKIAPAPGHTQKRLFTGRRIIYIISAACILLFILTLTHKKEMRLRNDIVFKQFYDWDNYDANRTISQQPLVINFYDRKGYIKEYLIE